MRDFRLMKSMQIALLAVLVMLLAMPLAEAEGGLPSHHYEQWYTGSLVSPSGAQPKAGILGIEPYMTYTEPAGFFRADGVRLPLPAHQRTVTSSTMFKYGVTDRLSLQTFPAMSYGWKDHGPTSSGIKFNDLPLDAILTVVKPHPEHYVPTVAVFAGVLAPTGDYSHLGRATDGVGGGAWVFRTAIVQQSTFIFPNGHNFRVRAWGNFRRAISSARLVDITSYGTERGFRGWGRPGINGQAGFSLEYGLSQRWVIAMDFARDWANGARVRGVDGNGRTVNSKGASSSDWQVAPAMEFSWSPRFGIVAGCAIYVAGHNTNMNVAPQFAVNTVF